MSDVKVAGAARQTVRDEWMAEQIALATLGVRLNTATQMPVDVHHRVAASHNPNFWKTPEAWRSSARARSLYDRLDAKASISDLEAVTDLAACDVYDFWWLNANASGLLAKGTLLAESVKNGADAVGHMLTTVEASVKVTAGTSFIDALNKLVDVASKWPSTGMVMELLIRVTPSLLSAKGSEREQWALSRGWDAAADAGHSSPSPVLPTGWNKSLFIAPSSVSSGTSALNAAQTRLAVMEAQLQAANQKLTSTAAALANAETRATRAQAQLDAAIREREREARRHVKRESGTNEPIVASSPTALPQPSMLAPSAPTTTQGGGVTGVLTAPPPPSEAPAKEDVVTVSVKELNLNALQKEKLGMDIDKIFPSQMLVSLSNKDKDKGASVKTWHEQKGHLFHSTVSTVLEWTKALASPSTAPRSLASFLNSNSVQEKLATLKKAEEEFSGNQAGSDRVQAARFAFAREFRFLVAVPRKKQEYLASTTKFTEALDAFVNASKVGASMSATQSRGRGHIPADVEKEQEEEGVGSRTRSKRPLPTPPPARR